MGKIFDKSKPFSEIKKLEKIPSKFIIFDNSEFLNIINYKFKKPHNLLENVILLNRYGIFTIDNIKIAYLSGIEDEKYLKFSSLERNLIYSKDRFKRENIYDLFRQKADNGKDCFIDILLTHTIPSIILEDLLNNKNSPLFLSLENERMIENKNIYNSEMDQKKIDYDFLLKYDKQNLEKWKSEACNLIAKEIKPRYHFTSVEDFFYEKMPYINYNISSLSKNESEKDIFSHYLNEEEKVLTRFINIAYVSRNFLAKYFLNIFNLILFYLK